MSAAKYLQEKLQLPPAVTTEPRPLETFFFFKVEYLPPCFYTEKTASRIYLCRDGSGSGPGVGTGGQTDRQTEGRLIDQTASLLLIYSDRKSITCLPLISPPLVFPAAPPSPLFSLASSAPVTHLCKCEGWGGSGGGRGWGGSVSGVHLWNSQ